MDAQDSENIGIIKEMYEHLSNGRIAEYFSLLSEEITYFAAGNCVISGKHIGIEKIKEIGMITMKETDRTHRVFPKEMISNGKYVAVVDVWNAERKGNKIEMENLLVYKIENGRISEIREFIGDEEQHDAFWQ